MKDPKPKVFSDPNYNRVGKSKRQEEKLARDTGGRRVRRSGGMYWSKNNKRTEDGDVVTKEIIRGWNFEHKGTTTGSITIKRDWLNKVRDGARAKTRRPAIVVTFDQGLKVQEDWVLIPRSIFDRLCEEEDDES
jgi:hypothetical protein